MTVVEHEEPMSEPIHPEPPQGDLQPAARRLSWLLVLFPLVAFFWSGWIGLDFGVHWDQGHRVDDLVHAFEEQTFLPEDYFYPSTTFYLTVAAAAPLAAEVVDLDRETDEFSGSTVKKFVTHEFQIRLRSIFLFVASLTLLWVFGTLLVWRARPLEALAAALILAGSFEVSYHARWVAPDAILMQFGALCLMACVAALRTPFSFSWLRAAAVAAGLAAGTKYTGGIFLLPVLIVAAGNPRPLREAVAAGLWFVGAFLISTPGALLEPTRFVADVLYEMQHYQKGHVGYTVEAGSEHLFKMLRYLLLHGPSSWPAISLVICGLGVVGAVATWRQSRRLALVLLVVPLLFVPYLAMQRVMFVRNLLLVMPVGALLAARGAGVLLDLARSAPRRGLVLGLVSILLGTNLVLVYQAGRSVQEGGPERLSAEIQGWLEGHTDRVVQLSPNVRVLLKKQGVESAMDLEHVRLRPGDDVEAVLLFPREGLTPGYWPSNDPDLKVAIGPLSANYDYYATWWSDHVVVIDRDDLYEIAALSPMPNIGRIFPELEGKQGTGRQRARKDAKKD